MRDGPGGLIWHYAGNEAVSLSGDKTLKVWDVDTGLLVVTFYCDAPARCCAFIMSGAATRAKA